MNSDSLAVVVLGMHRSGTSALSRLVEIIGFRQASNLVGANRTNPLGHWEPFDVVRLNDRLLQKLGRHWADPKPLPEGWAEGEQHVSNVSVARSTLRNAYGDLGGIVLKDPRISRVFPIWRDALLADQIEPVCLIACRNPIEVYQSLQTRDDMGFDQALHLWLSYMMESEAATRGMRRVVVDYRQILEDWHGTLWSAFEGLGLRGFDSLGLARQHADAFIDASHQHYSSSIENLHALTETHAETRLAYQHFLSDPHLNDIDALDGLHSRWQSYWERKCPGTQGSEFAHWVPRWHPQRASNLDENERNDHDLIAARKVLEQEPDNAKRHYHLGSLLLGANQLEEAATKLRDAIRLDDRVPHFHQRYSNTLNKLGRSEEAIMAARRALELEPENAQRRNHLGGLLLGANRLDEAETELRKAICIDDGVAQFHHRHSIALNRLGRRDDAVSAAARALELDPDSASRHGHLGSLLLGLNRVVEAELELRKAISIDDGVPQIHHQYGTVLYKLGRIEKAITAARKALELTPSNAQWHWNLGTYLSETGLLEEAAEAFDTSVALDAQKFGIPLSASGEIFLSDENESRLNSTGADDAASRNAFRRMHAHFESGRVLKDCARLLEGRPLDADCGTQWLSKLGSAAFEHVPLEKREVDAPDLRLSVMIPVFNPSSSRMLQECIGSVLAQDLDPNSLEIVVVDDASMNTVAEDICKSIDPRIQYVRNPCNLGLVGNHNRCLALSKGEFVHILHQDDQVEPGFYSALLDPMERNPDVLAAFSRSVFMDEQGQEAGAQRCESDEAGILSHWSERLALYQRIMFPSIVVRRTAYETLGGFTPSHFFAFDWEMWARLACSGPIWYDPRPLAKYRAHSGSATHTIESVDRLFDELRTSLRIASYLPQARRLPTARIAFTKLLFRHWKSVSPGAGPTMTAKNQRLIEALFVRQ